MQSANPPKRHHYIPAFYLSRWASPHDNKLTQYSKPHKIVVDARAAPGATGFETELYSIPGIKPSSAQVIEQKFFSPIDNLAAKALELIEAEGNNAVWSDIQRSAWSRFLISLMLRCPEDIRAFKDFWPTYFAKTDLESEAKYRENRRPNDPETFQEFIIAQPTWYMEATRSKLLTNLIDNSRVGEKINAMHWQVIVLNHGLPTLLTSDRPMIMQVPLNEPGGHIALPIGPYRLFIASHEADLINQVLSVPHLELARGANRQVVEAAVSFVYGTDASQLRFVQNRMGRNQTKRLLQQIAESRNATTRYRDSVT